MSGMKLNGLLYSWKKKNGLDYNGWWRFLLKRWMRKNGFKRLVPFDMRLDWRNSNNVEIDIWEYGKYRKEKFTFGDDVYAGDVIDRLRKMGMVSSKNRYLVLRALGKRI